MPTFEELDMDAYQDYGAGKGRNADPGNWEEAEAANLPSQNRKPFPLLPGRAYIPCHHAGIWRGRKKKVERHRQLRRGKALKP